MTGLETERLLLRQWRESDLPEFARLNGDSATMAWMPAVLTAAESNALAQRLADGIAQRGWGCWAVERSEDARCIGFVGLNPVRDDLPFAPAIEVGWRLHRDFWGQGYATEAARASLEYGFRALGLQEILSFTALTNHRSRALMQRLGLRETGPDFDHPALAEGDALRRHCLYRLTRDAWLARRA